MADPRDWPDDNETETRDPTVIEFPFSLRTNETDAVPDDVVVMIDENPISASAGGSRGVGTSGGGTETSRGDADDTEEEETTEKGVVFLQRLGSGFRNNWPRVHAVLLGVIIPFVLLVGSAMLFGQAIVWAESAPELNRNEDSLTEASLAGKTLEILTRGAENSLNYCLATRVARQPERIINFELEFRNITDKVRENTEPLFALFEENSELNSIQNEIANTLASTNIESVAASVSPEDILECDKVVGYVMSLMLQTVPFLQEKSQPTLTFHWNQCIRSEDTLEWSSNYHPDAQRDYYTELWDESRDSYYDSVAGGNNDGTFDLGAYLEASRMATVPDDACEYNRMGASWFWFSTMTTVGFGDIVPQTDLGRMFIYTGGFASILVFFGVIGNAGNVLNMVLDDLLQQMSYDNLSSSLFGFVYWCGLYFAWMLLLGRYYTDWNDEILGIDDMDRLEGFWFAFSSLSTIGFGDLGVNVEVFQLGDFLVYSSLFISGFFFLSLGCNKLWQAVSAGEDEEPRTLKGRLDAVPISKINDTSTLEQPEDPVLERPGLEESVPGGSQSQGLPFSTSHSLATPMETVFTRENKDALSNPASASNQ